MTASPTDGLLPAANGREHPANGRLVGLLVTTALLVLTQLYAAIPLIPLIGTALGAEVTFAISTAFSMCYAIGFLVWGPLADHYGRRRIILIGLALLSSATIACSFASSLPALAALRAVQGLTASSFAPVALAYLAEATPPAKRPLAIGSMSTAFLVAGIAGQVFASAISGALGWTWVFALSAVALTACFIGVAFMLIENPRRSAGTTLYRHFQAVGRVTTRPAVLLLSTAHLTLLFSFVAMYTALAPQMTALGLESSDVFWVHMAGLPGMFISILVGPLARRLETVEVARTGFALAALGLGLEAALSGSLVGTATGSLVYVAGVALAVLPAMITLFGESAAPNRAGGMALNGFVLFLGASLGPLTARLQLNFPTLLAGLAMLMIVAVAALTGFARLTRSAPGSDSQ